MVRSLKLGILLIGFLLVSSCSKDEGLKTLEGDWILVSTSGGFSGAGIEIEGDITMTIEGDDLIMFLDEIKIIESNLSYEKDENLEVITINISFRDATSPYIFASSERLSFNIMGESMTLIELCDDCFSYHFDKK